MVNPHSLRSLEKPSCIGYLSFMGRKYQSVNTLVHTFVWFLSCQIGRDLGCSQGCIHPAKANSINVT